MTRDALSNIIRARPFPLPTRDETLPDAIICDIDNTLAYTGNRDYFDLSKALEDPVVYPVRSILKAFQGSARIILLSGRTEKAERKTIQWLHKNDVPYDELVLRRRGDSRSDRDFKKDFCIRNIKGVYNILFVLEDRLGVTKMFREDLGYFVMQVSEGRY